MTDAHRAPTPADPARHAPSEARPDSCTCCGGQRQPDPTDDFIVMLKELAHIGMRLARVTVAKAEEEDAKQAAVPAAATTEPDVAAEIEAEDATPAKPAAEPRTARQLADLAYQRVSRSIRLCMNLAVKFHTDRLAREKQIEATKDAAKSEHRKRLKTQLKNLVGKTIERQFEVEKERLIESEDEFFDEQVETEKEDRLYDALLERLEDEDIEHDLDEISQGALYGRICQDLGVQPDWERWGHLFQAMDEGRRKVPGSPFVREPEPQTLQPEPEKSRAEEAKPDEPKPDKPEPEAPTAQPLHHFDRMRASAPDPAYEAFLRSKYPTAYKNSG